MKMCLAAGLTVQREPTHLLPAEPGIRPGDLYVSDWTLEGVLQVNHAIDFTAPSVDGGWSILTPAEKSLRATRPGVAAQRREEFKRSHPGTAEAQEIRGDNLSMTERCRQQRIHFWPVAIEVDGVIPRVALSEVEGSVEMIPGVILSDVPLTMTSFTILRL